ncbi:MAG TPA: HEAT repeat domain-containing protein [Tepidisphaeraceae bacterium]
MKRFEGIHRRVRFSGPVTFFPSHQITGPLKRTLQAAAIILLLGTGCQQKQQKDVADFGQRMLNYFTGSTPINAAKKMEDQYFPDERREGIAKLSDESAGRGPIYTKRYEQIAQFDSDWLVRATAIRALNRSRDTAATPIFIRALSDDNDIVRVEAAKALANNPDPNATSVLVRIVSNANENKDVRIWSADALKHYKSLEVARTLTNQLGGREFGVSWQSRKSLIILTGRDLGYDESAWLEYLTGPDRPFS